MVHIVPELKTPKSRVTDFQKLSHAETKPLTPQLSKSPPDRPLLCSRMSSQRRIQSSRANGAKSRGPVTPAGRRKSSQNNLRHGLLAEAVVLDEEKPEAFFELLGNLTCEHNPQTETQRILVETMAIARWRLTRLWAIERETLQAEIHKHDPAEHSEPARAALAFRGLADQGRTLDILNRHESRLDRQYARSLNLLMKLAAPDNPLTQFRHTNPVPLSDSGIGLPACGTPAPHPGGTPVPHPGLGDEVPSLPPSQPAPPEPPTHAEPTSVRDPRPLTPDPQFAPSQPAASDALTHAEPASAPDPRPLTPDPQPVPQSQHLQNPPPNPSTHYPPTAYNPPRPVPAAPDAPENHPPRA